GAGLAGGRGWRPSRGGPDGDRAREGRAYRSPQLAVLPRGARVGDRRRPGCALVLGRGHGPERRLEGRRSRPRQLEPRGLGRSHLCHDRGGDEARRVGAHRPLRRRRSGGRRLVVVVAAAWLWQQVAHVGQPRIRRHTKSTHANPSPATDGKVVVAMFGSEGLFAYDVAGRLLWKKDLGVLDSGWFYDHTYQWGFSSSPVIYED